MIIAPETSLDEALKRMSYTKLEQLSVMRGDQLLGMITQTGLLRFLEIKRLLSGPQGERFAAEESGSSN